MVVLIRALTYATLFIALVLVFVPGTVLAWPGVTRPERWGPVQVVGLVVAALGLALALWCVLTFAFVGRGTPAPFYRSFPLLGYVALFLLVCHLFVVVYEEPTLRRSLGAEYEDYSRRVRRWRPRWRP